LSNQHWGEILIGLQRLNKLKLGRPWIGKDVLNPEINKRSNEMLGAGNSSQVTHQCSSSTRRISFRTIDNATINRGLILARKILIETAATNAVNINLVVERIARHRRLIKLCTWVNLVPNYLLAVQTVKVVVMGGKWWKQLIANATIE
jgi:hypothetical protein